MLAQTMCTSFKLEQLTGGYHNFGTDTFKIALYTASATLNADTTVYSATNEITGTGYTAGGAALTVVAPTSSGAVAMASFQNPSWSTASFTARGALIYNSSKANRAVLVLDFGADKTATATTFLITMPAVASDTAILRFA